MNIRKICVSIFASLLLLTACGGTKATPAAEVAAILETKELDKQMVNTPFKFGSGDVEVASVLDFYKTNNAKWEEMIKADNIPVQYDAGVAAQKYVTGFLVDALTKEKISSVAYVGDSDNGEVSGLFIYYFDSATDIPLELNQMILSANELTTSTKAGEYYFVQGNYFIAYEQSFVKDVNVLTEILQEGVPA